MEQFGMMVTVARDDWGAVVSVWVCMRIPLSDSCSHDQREEDTAAPWEEHIRLISALSCACYVSGRVLRLSEARGEMCVVCGFTDWLSERKGPA